MLGLSGCIGLCSIACELPLVRSLLLVLDVQISRLLLELRLLCHLEGLVRSGRADVACLGNEEEYAKAKYTEEYSTNAKGLFNVSTFQRHG